MTHEQLINAYYLAFSKGLVDSVNLNGNKSSAISHELLLLRCEGFPSDILEKAKRISCEEAFSIYITARSSR